MSLPSASSHRVVDSGGLTSLGRKSLAGHTTITAHVTKSLFRPEPSEYATRFHCRCRYCEQCVTVSVQPVLWIAAVP